MNFLSLFTQRELMIMGLILGSLILIILILIISEKFGNKESVDILEEDVVCIIGQEDRKILLFDNFKSVDFETGEILGNPGKDKSLIDKLPKAY